MLDFFQTTNPVKASHSVKYSNVLVIDSIGEMFIINTDVVTQCRKKYNCNQREFGKLMGWSSGQQSIFESVSIKKIRLKTLFKIYYAFGFLAGSNRNA